MNLVRFLNDANRPTMGVLAGNEVYDIGALDPELADWFSILSSAQDRGVSILERIMATTYAQAAPVHRLDAIRLLTPVEAPEVWAAGVTYESSRLARNLESSRGNVEEQTVYDRVYAAARPELFWKSNAARTVAPGDTLRIRSDSSWQIPEPEVGLVLGFDGTIRGFTAGNDLSSRDIEGENPLYLPQAKVWHKSCSFGPSIRLAETVKDPYQLTISCRIVRQGTQVFYGEASTAQLKRTFDELVGYLRRDNIIFEGTVLLTGTCIVPDEDFTLQGGDRIEIGVSEVGVLVNTIEKEDQDGSSV